MFFLDFDCSSILPLIKLIRRGVLPAIQIITVIVVLVLIALDFLKAASAAKEDEIKTAQKMAIKRLIYGAAVFFSVLLVQVVFGLLSTAGSEYNGNGWETCWKQA